MPDRLQISGKKLGSNALGDVYSPTNAAEKELLGRIGRLGWWRIDIQTGVSIKVEGYLVKKDSTDQLRTPQFR
jgi:hypothetical protein